MRTQNKLDSYIFSSSMHCFYLLAFPPLANRQYTVGQYANKVALHGVLTVFSAGSKHILNSILSFTISLVNFFIFSRDNKINQKRMHLKWSLIVICYLSALTDWLRRMHPFSLCYKLTHQCQSIHFGESGY